MKNTPKPPDWSVILTNELIKKSLNSSDLQMLIRKAQKGYLYWDTFKYQPMPDGFKSEEAWAILKLNRVSLYQPTPIKTGRGDFFKFAPVNALYQKLNYIDTYASGFIKTFSETTPTEAQKNKFIISGLTEEAIATSQIEGANTSRKVAKEMLASQRQPRTKDEQMIINSYQVAQRLDGWKDFDLSKDMLLEIQALITDKTIEKSDQGRFRNDEDNIVVHDPLSGEIAHEPVKKEQMLLQLDKLIEFANKAEEDEDFVHPVVKAAILHFWLAYLHPFVDGNGRTARALFYWYLLKKEYWLVKYLSISRAIVQTRKKYDSAFIYSENDDNDLTYFVLYITDVFKTSIVKFVEYFKEKIKETEELKKISDNLKDYNPRQIALLKYFLDHLDQTTDVNLHQTKHGVSRITALNDLKNLVQKGMLVQTAKKRKYIFIPNVPFIKKLFKV